MSSNKITSITLNGNDDADLETFRSQSSLSSGMSGVSIEINDSSSLYTSNEPNFIIHTSRLRSKGIYEIEYIGNIRTGIILRNTIEHTFDDNTIHCIIDIEDIIDGNDDNSVIISDNLRKIVDVGDILVKVNGKKVGKSNLMDVSKWLLNSNNDMTKTLMFLKPDMVPLSLFLLFDKDDNNDDYKVIYPPEQIIKCSRCKYHVEKQWKFCNNCGNNLTLSTSLSSISSTSKKKKQAKDFIEKVNHDQYLNRSMYSSITINDNKFNENIDFYNNDNNDDTILTIDKTILKSIDERINSLNSDEYKKYKKKMILAEMLADELELKNAEFVEESYRKIVEESKIIDDDMITDFII